jgi:GNAT superfamily N-acetyltransferase
MDSLVKLYELRADSELEERLRAEGIVVRRLLAPELRLLNAWIEPRFGPGWVSEATAAAARQPPACFVATRRDALIGFACHEATAKGFFGPTGVDEAFRGRGVGHALLLATLLDMRASGYAYAIIGGGGELPFYRKTVGAVPIRGSAPGFYRGMLPLTQPGEPNASQTLPAVRRSGRPSRKKANDKESGT